MNKSVAVAAGILFIVIFCILAYNNFEVNILIGKTQEVRGEITGIEWVRSGDAGWFQKVSYTYEVGGISYTGTKQVGRKWGAREVGNGVKVRYLLRKPRRSKAVGFYERRRGQ